MIPQTGASKQMVTFGFARSSTCLSFLKALFETSAKLLAIQYVASQLEQPCGL
uniref:Uncharacterized protein n=1 Tax=Arundo donax TaxID=35708 RepID=A0A0A9E5H9_ARUDO